MQADNHRRGATDEEVKALIEVRQILDGWNIPIEIRHLRALESCLEASEATNEELRRAVLRAPAAVMS